MKDINMNDDGNGSYDLIVVGAGSAGFSASSQPPMLGSVSHWSGMAPSAVPA